LLGWLVLQLRRVVFVAHIVSDTHKLATIVGTCKQNDGNAQDFGRRKFGNIRGVGLEEKLVDSDRDRADKQVVKFLIVFRATEIGV
jgi:hypothetical protein